MARGLATANRGTAATAGAIVAPRQLLPLLLAAAVAALALLPAPAAAAAKCGKLSLLAVGDSITKGSIPSQQRNTPYADTTRDALSAMLGGCFDVQTTTAGALLVVVVVVVVVVPLLVLAGCGGVLWEGAAARRRLRVVECDLRVCLLARRRLLLSVLFSPPAPLFAPRSPSLSTPDPP